jgi:hypothetical protein
MGALSADDAACQAPFSGILGLAHNSSLPPKGIPPAVRARRAPLCPLAFQAKKRFGLWVLDYAVTSNIFICW